MDITVYAKHIEPVHFQAGEVIFHRGDEGDVMYVIGDGEVEIRVADDYTVKVGRGDTFGEMSIIDQVARSADAVALADVELYPINRGLFLVLVQETPYFALEVMKSLCAGLRRHNVAED